MIIISALCVLDLWSGFKATPVEICLRAVVFHESISVSKTREQRVCPQAHARYRAESDSRCLSSCGAQEEPWGNLMYYNSFVFCLLGHCWCGLSKTNVPVSCNYEIASYLFNLYYSQTVANLRLTQLMYPQYSSTGLFKEKRSTVEDTESQLYCTEKVAPCNSHFLLNNEFIAQKNHSAKQTTKNKFLKSLVCFTIYIFKLSIDCWLVLVFFTPRCFSWRSDDTQNRYKSRSYRKEVESWRTKRFLIFVQYLSVSVQVDDIVSYDRITVYCHKYQL